VGSTGAGQASSYYEGNIKTCNEKGMRLPTMYETTMEQPINNPLPNGDSLDSAPTWAESSGVPGYNATDYVWTSSAYLGLIPSYWVWKNRSDTSTNTSSNSQFNQPKYVRCVLPSH